MKIIAIAFLILFFLAFLFLFNFFVFRSAAHFFGIAEKSILNIVYVLAALSSVSFILASLFVRSGENFLTRSFYLAAASWLGYVFILFFIMLACLLIEGVLRKIGWQIDSKVFGYSSLLFALCLSIYGYWNAQNVTTKELEVELKNLPANWSGKTIVQISDLHIGAINRSEFAEKTVETVNSMKPDVVFITGDYFDGAEENADLLAEPLKKIRALKGVFFVTGNHEVYLGAQKATDAMRSAGVTVLDDQAINLDGLNIVGLSYPQRGEKKEAAALLEKLNPRPGGILLYHEPSLVEQAAAGGIDLMLSGHTHQGQIWPFYYAVRAVYGKYIYGLNKSGDMSVYVTSGTGTWGPPLRLGSRSEIIRFKLR